MGYLYYIANSQISGIISQEGTSGKHFKLECWLTSEKYCPLEQDNGRLEISMFMTVSARPLHTQVKLNSSLERGGGHEVPPLTEEMRQLTMLREEESVFCKSASPDEWTMLESGNTSKNMWIPFGCLTWKGHKCG